MPTPTPQAAPEPSAPPAEAAADALQQTEAMVSTGLKRALDFELSTLGDQPLTLATLLAGVVVLVVAFGISRGARSAVRRTGERRGVDPGHISVINRLLHYGIMLVGTAIAVETVGIDLSAMFAAGAVFAVGIGFAMQTIAEGFVAGMILLMEGAIKPGDVLDHEGQVVKVVTMNIRSTIVRTVNGTEIILPNSELVKAPVHNLTLSDRKYRVDVVVGVAYESDMDLVERTLIGVAHSLPFAELPAASREVRIVGFGANSVDWEVSVWTTDPWARPDHKDDIHHLAWRALHEAGISIAYPQLDLHLDDDALAALRRRPAAEA